MQNVKIALAAFCFSASSAFCGPFDFASSLTPTDSALSMLEESSSAIGASESLQCPGLKLPTFNIGNIVDSISSKFGFCNVSTKEKNLQCFNQKMNYIRNPSSMLPSGSLFRGDKESVTTGSCMPYSNAPTATAVKNIAPNLFSYESHIARECLRNGGGNCKTSLSSLPSNLDESEKEIATTAMLLTSGNGSGAVGAAGAEYGSSIEIEKRCSNDSNPAACAGKAAVSAYQDRQNTIGENLKKVGNAEYVLLRDATIPRRYFLETTTELQEALPIEKRADFASASKRAMSAEAYLKKLSSDIASISLELEEARKNKLVFGSTPILSTPINNYVQSMSSALDSVPMP